MWTRKKYCGEFYQEQRRRRTHIERKESLFLLLYQAGPRVHKAIPILILLPITESNFLKTYERLLGTLVDILKIKINNILHYRNYLSLSITVQMGDSESVPMIALDLQRDSINGLFKRALACSKTSPQVSQRCFLTVSRTVRMNCCETW